jgi:glycosyltransferase involved in cell wall biosynthesis
MKIVMDFRKYDGVVGGVEQGVFQVTKYMTEHGHPVVMLCKKNRLSETGHLFEGFTNLRIVALNVTTHIISARNSLLDSTVIQDVAQEESADAIHFPYNWSFPRNKKVPSVLTIHDVIPFTFREAQSLFTNLLKYRPSIRKAGRLNDIIATVSEFSKRDIAAKVGIPLGKIRVIYNGLRDPNPPNRDLERHLKQRFGLDERFILNVGGIHERKNIVRLVHAFSKFIAKKGYRGKLVVTGKARGAPYQDRMRRLCDRVVRETGVEERVVFTDFISEEELDALFRMTDMLVYPSLYEGFGIPVLEAMKLGVPAVTSSTSALPEVAGGAALLVDPADVEAIASAMARMLTDKDLRNELRARGIERAKAYTWDRNAEAYLEVYRELAGS